MLLLAIQEDDEDDDPYICIEDSDIPPEELPTTPLEEPKYLELSEVYT